MNAFFSGLLSLLTGGISNIFTNGGFSNLGKILGKAGETANDIGNQNMLGNYVAKLTGSRLTDAEREANAFSTQQSEVAFNRELEASNTAYQRKVADFMAAGINPMMAVSSGVQLPSSSSPTSVFSGSSGSLLADLSSLVQLREQIGLIRAQRSDLEASAANKRADTALKESQTEAQRFMNDVNMQTRESIVKGRELENNVKEAEIDRIYAQKDDLLSSIKQREQSVKESISKIALQGAQMILARSNAYSILQLLPFEQALKSAQTKQAKFSAALSGIQYIYQKHLVTDGYLDSVISDMASRASVSLSTAQLLAIKAGLRTGEFPKEFDKSLFDALFTSEGIVQFATILFDNFNFFNNLIGMTP